MFYAFLIDGQGNYGLFLHTADNGYTVVQAYTTAPSGVIKGGINVVNHLTVICKGDKITLAVNGTTLITVAATLVGPGNIGLIVDAPSGSNGVEASFKDLRLSPLG